jgi:hypothetical protein
MSRFLVIAFGLIAALALPAFAQDSNSHDKTIDVRSSVGDMHLGADGDARKAGFAPYPGARIKDDKDQTPANLSLFTEAFGVKLVVAKYESDDAPAKVIDFYRDKLKKYGKVLECHTQKHGDNGVDIDDDDKDSKNKELKCSGDNSGPVTELKVGTEDDQHVVAIEPGEASKGTSFALVYVHLRGKQGDI